MNRRQVICTAAALLVVAVANAGSSARTTSVDGCGTKKASADLLCRRYGSVTQAAPSPADAAPVAVEKGPVTVPSGSTVHVGTHSLATMTFARQARCAFGVVGRTTEIVTRFGGDPASEPPLYWQRFGNARCTFSGTVRPQTFFCELSVECPVVVTTRGRTEEASRVRLPVRASRAAHAADATTVTPVTLDFCTGEFRVDVSDEFGGGSVGGGGTSEVNGVREPTHVRVVIQKVDTVTQTETTTVEHHEITIEAHAVSGRGECAARAFRQRRR
jgi:hypothetical protein